MKKKVKSLIVVAAVAAIAGIGAVSFAAWNSNTTNSIAKNGHTLGEVSITGGFVKTGANDYEELKLVKADEDEELHLVPWDQDEGTRVLVFQIPDYQVCADKQYRLWLTATGLQEGSTFKYKIGEDAATAPTDDDEFAAWGHDLGYVYAGAEGDYEVEETPTENTTVSGMLLTVIMDSSNLGDMGASIEFTLHFEDGGRRVNQPKPEKPENPPEEPEE